MYIYFQITEEVELEDATDKVQSSSIPDRAINKTQLSPLGTEVSLEEFEKNQKMIKEQNRQKEELLKKALKDRSVGTVLHLMSQYLLVIQSTGYVTV